MGLVTSRPGVYTPTSPVQQLLNAFKTFSAEEWQEARWYNKIYFVISVSFFFCLEQTRDGKERERESLQGERERFKEIS